MTTDDRSDNQLVEARDISALFERYNHRLISFLHRKIHGIDIDDIAQEAWVKVVTRIDSFDPGRAVFSTWLFHIARNTGIDALRRHRTYRKYVAASLTGYGTFGETSIDPEDQSSHIPESVSGSRIH